MVFKKILIANRGEIACRVMRTARRLGMRAAAVFAEPDRGSLHVKSADEAHLIKDYLDIDSVIAAARAAGAEAIHPGYGFLAENEDFAAACEKAGVVFIGPTPQAIAAMGDKAAAKRLMEKAGVPLVPGYHGDSQDPALLEEEAARIGFPVLIKPSAGGGGKGMRIVSEKKSFLSALEASKREAKSSFGDDRVLIERYLERPRHIEMQIFGDSHGNVVHLFERDCSVQRRHQKVLEESPAPAFAKRKEMAAAAVAAAKAIRYTNAGTVEFIAEQDGRFYFMEMNTRLQVEHPVTEMITGLDLVEWQLRVAAGEELPLTQKEISPHGHAIEARIYAEDPGRDFLPSTGKIVHLAFPQQGPDVRVDAGVEASGAITPWYDPMIAKLIVRGSDRADALAKLRRALGETEIAGVTTNVAFLGRIAATRAFSSAELDTGLIERNRAELFPPRSTTPREMLEAAARAELATEELAARERAQASGDPHSPWFRADGWRLAGDTHHDFTFLDGDERHTVRVSLSDRPRDASARAIRDGSNWHVFWNGQYRKLSLQDELQAHDADLAPGSLAAPMPGKVIQVLVRTGARVKKGEALLILEAMKMEHTITAPADGVVREIRFAAGEQVLEGAELITLE